VASSPPLRRLGQPRPPRPPPESKALGRRPGIPALAAAYSIGYEAKSLPVPGGIDILDVDRRAERLVMADNC